MPKFARCCVPQCGTNGSGHCFPLSDKLRCKQWLAAIRRESSFKPTKHTMVCKKHFAPEDYLNTTENGIPSSRQILKKCVTPHIFEWTKPVTPAQLARRDRQGRRSLCGQFIAEDDSIALYEENIIGEPSSHQPQIPVYYSVTTQTEEYELKEFIEIYRDNAAAIHYFTGLESYSKFKLLLQCFGPVIHELKYYNGRKPKISTEDQLMLTLMKLRLYRPNFELSLLFHTNSESDVQSIFITWINFMYCFWENIDIWPSLDLIDYYFPEDFKSKFPQTRLIVDGTEIPICKPKQPVAQQSTFSTYKNRNTMKVLIGITPGGLVSYVSPAYGGSTSDRQIVERSQLPTLCEPRTAIMADKGFNVQDIFEVNQVQINIPTFFKKKNRMAASTVIHDRKIASKRVHVERIIGLAKTYKILKEPLLNTEAALSTQIVKVCFMLCNFRKRIISHNA